MANFRQVWRGEKVEMILKGCVLADELARKAGYNKDRYRRIFKGQYEVFDNRSYIPKSILKTQKDIEASKRCTNLDDYLPLSYFSRYLLNVHPFTVRARIKFCNETGIKLFDFKRINGQYYIKIPQELQQKLKKGITVAITDWKSFRDYEDVNDYFIFGDFCIVFYS